MFNSGNTFYLYLCLYWLFYFLSLSYHVYDSLIVFHLCPASLPVFHILVHYVVLVGIYFTFFLMFLFLISYLFKRFPHVSILVFFSLEQ